MKVAVTSPSFSKHPDLIELVNREFNEVKLNITGKKFSEQELVEYLKGYQFAIVGLDEINENVLKQLPELKFISKYGVGLNNIDLDACKSRNVLIGWTGGVNRLSVAEMTLGNMIVLSRNIYQSSNLLSRGKWEKEGGSQLTGKTVGIIGVGFIGKEVIRLLKPFNCNILVNDIINQNEYYNKENLKESTKEEIFRNADIITVHTPLTSETKNLINKEVFNIMKNGAVVINSARGGIINEEDLKTNLKNNKISAALDVYDNEPPRDMELLSMPNLICTPHIGGNSKEAVYLMGKSAVNHIVNYMQKDEEKNINNIL